MEDANYMSITLYRHIANAIYGRDLREQLLALCPRAPQILQWITDPFREARKTPSFFLAAILATASALSDASFCRHLLGLREELSRQVVEWEGMDSLSRIQGPSKATGSGYKLSTMWI
ncbi:hypothetical protein LIER_42916 [Lithospermum erythrorhizon]|uniref:Uncharacterized protein n=1 Tax=Lithospermum erythrorhizon TaxID=34254 RepID=A0AAV3P4Y0_LITER